MTTQDDDAIIAAASALWSMHGIEGETPADFLDTARICLAAARPVMVDQIHACLHELRMDFPDLSRDYVIVRLAARAVMRGGAS